MRPIVQTTIPRRNSMIWALQVEGLLVLTVCVEKQVSLLVKSHILRVLRPEFSTMLGTFGKYLLVNTPPSQLNLMIRETDK